jgi:hypothetical protein
MQRVKIGNIRSGWQLLKRGVPQGSLTGPLLFNIFLNDFLLCIKKCSVFNYADDNTLSYQHSNVDYLKNVIETDTKNAIHWLNSNYMQANAGKFQAMILSRFNCNINLKIDNIVIETTDHVKLLGVMVDNSLCFNLHVSNLCKKAGRRLNCMARLCNLLNEECLSQLMDAFINSSFNYCTSVWHFCGNRLSRKIEKMQERALRLVYKDHVSSYSGLLLKSGKCTMYNQRINNIAVCVFKLLQGDLKPVPVDFYCYKDNAYSLRNVKPLVRPGVNTITYGINSLRYEGVVIWEKLPNYIKEKDALEDFKRCIKSWKVSCDCSMCTRCVCQL